MKSRIFREQKFVGNFAGCSRDTGRSKDAGRSRDTGCSRDTGRSKDAGRSRDTGGRVQEAGCRKQGAGSRVQEAGCRKQGAGSRCTFLDGKFRQNFVPKKGLNTPTGTPESILGIGTV
jgi:hypothetical protein